MMIEYLCKKISHLEYEKIHFLQILGLLKSSKKEKTAKTTFSL